MSAGRKVVAVAATLFAAIFAATSAAQAEADYPNRPVTLIVPYAAGGVADVGMRILGEQLSNRLKQQFVVENRPGAAGIVAAQTGAQAAPDGYTLLMTGNNTAIAVALFKSLPYNILTDFDFGFDRRVLRRADRHPRRLAAEIGCRSRRRGEGQSRQAQYRHHQSGLDAKPRRRAVHQHRRHQGGDRAVPRLARHGRRGDARRRRCRIRILCRAQRAPRRQQDRGAGLDRRQAHRLSARRADRHGERHQGLRRRQLERPVGSRRHAEAGHRHAQCRHERGHSQRPTCNANPARWAWPCAGARRKT